MTLAILAFLFLIEGFLLGYGDYGRGTWSRYISIFAGLLWLGTIIYAFVAEGIKLGIISIFVSFIIAGIGMAIGKAVILKMRGKP